MQVASAFLRFVHVKESRNNSAKFSFYSFVANHTAVPFAYSGVLPN